MKDYQHTLALSLSTNWRIAHQSTTFDQSLRRWLAVTDKLDGISSWLIWSDDEEAYEELKEDFSLLQGIAVKLAGDYSLPIKASTH